MNSKLSPSEERRSEIASEPLHDVLQKISPSASCVKVPAGKRAESKPRDARVPIPPALPSTWVLTQVNLATHDNKRISLHNSIPHALLIIDARAHFILHIVLAQELSRCLTDRHSFAPASNPINFDTHAYFGKLRMSETKVQMHIEHSSIPVLEGINLNAGYVIDGDRLTFVTTLPLENTARDIYLETLWLRYAAKV